MFVQFVLIFKVGKWEIWYHLGFLPSASVHLARGPLLPWGWGLGKLGGLGFSLPRPSSFPVGKPLPLLSPSRSARPLPP